MISGRIAMVAAGLWLSPATLAQAQVLPTLPIAKTVVSGVDTPIARASGWESTTCVSRVHSVNLTRPPAHGTISVLDEITTIPASTQRGGSTGVCAGKPLADKQIVYRSNPGFVGVDTFSYESVDPNGTRGPFDVTITVIATASGTTPAPPQVAAAAIYRMLIQSHADVGGKCVDVPFGQMVVGMRIQMWECNNRNGQTFAYDEQSQQLKIGDKCVEVWGRGDPQDAVGLGTCNSGLNQHWRMVASKDYYQIIGINNRCLEVRYGLNNNGAALDVMDCDVNRPQRLWALIEAPH